jgi:hypothetical protein
LLADAFKEYPGVTSAWIMLFAGCLWQLDPTFFTLSSTPQQAYG